jgi:hypothetical protein
LILASAAVLPVAVEGATIRVPMDQPTIQAGISAASIGDTVLVAPGTYTGIGNHDLDFGGKAILLRSSGGATATTINCAGAGRGLNFITGEGPNTVVDGFTVTAGFLLQPAGKPSSELAARLHARYPEHLRKGELAAKAGGGESGAAILCIASAPTIKNCRFINNHALAGGAVAVVNSLGIRFEGCYFSGNRADSDGGGILAVGSTLNLSSCTFHGNHAGDAGFGQGGGINTDNGWLIATDCTFTNNEARSTGDDFQTGADGGGLYASGTYTGLTSCHFENNAALATNDDTQVGNIARGGGAVLIGTDIVLTQCTFIKNSVDGNSGPKSIGPNQALGGGLYCQGAVLNNCIIGQNTATTSGSPSNNLSSGGGIYGADVVLIDCVIRKNAATSTADTLVMRRGEGGGASVGAGAHLVGCTLSGNSATTTGGGLYMQDSWIFRVEKSIIVNSTSGGAVGCFMATTPVFSCTDIFANTGGDWAGCIAGQVGSSGNFSADPLFCDVANDNYGLDSKSPCAPGNMPGTCGLIGALPVSCGLIDVADLGAPTVPAGAKVTPNPIASTGLLEWHNPSPGETSLRLYDATGRLVVSRELGDRGQGRQHASWGQVVGGENVPAGVYFLRVKAPASEDQVVRVVVAR